MDYLSDYLEDWEDIEKWDKEHKSQSITYSDYIMLTNERV